MSGHVDQIRKGDEGNTTISAVTNGNASYLTINDVITATAFSGGADASTRSAAIVRGVIFVPSGVVPTLSSPQTRGHQTALEAAVPGDANEPQSASGLMGSPFGDVTVTNGAQEFVLMLNGHKQSDAYVNIITASFDPGAPNNFGKILNTDPTKIEDAGHYLYADWQIGKNYATSYSKSISKAG